MIKKMHIGLLLQYIVPNNSRPKIITSTASCQFHKQNPMAINHDKNMPICRLKGHPRFRTWKEKRNGLVSYKKIICSLSNRLIGFIPQNTYIYIYIDDKLMDLVLKTKERKEKMRKRKSHNFSNLTNASR